MKKIRIIRSIARYGFMAFFNLFYSIDEIDKDKLPKEGGYVLCSNHIHWLDPVLYVCENKRMVYPLGKEELFNNPFKNKLMRYLGLIPVHRGAVNGSKESTDEAVKVLKEGDMVLIYPEGTRNGLAKGIKPKKGVSLIAMQAGVKVVPMAMVGSFRLFSKVRFKIGDPIDFSEYYPKEGEQVNLRNMVKMTNIIMEKIIALRDEIQTPEIQKEMDEAEAAREAKKAKKLAKKEAKLAKKQAKESNTKEIENNVEVKENNTETNENENSMSSENCIQPKETNDTSASENK